MPLARLQDVLRIYEQALLRADAERPGYLDSACRNDADLRREVEALLAERSAAAGRPLDTLPGRPPRWKPVSASVPIEPRKAKVMELRFFGATGSRRQLRLLRELRRDGRPPVAGRRS